MLRGKGVTAPSAGTDELEQLLGEQTQRETPQARQQRHHEPSTSAMLSASSEPLM